MSQHDLATYLNDHLAGSVGAIELLSDLIETTPQEGRKQEMISLQGEIVADQDLLKRILESTPSDESTLKKAGAWMAQKLARAKLRLTESADSGLGEVEAFEILSLGIEGKRGLWKALAELPPHVMPHADWAQLQSAAESQRARVEQWRLEAARHAFRSDATDAHD